MLNREKMRTEREAVERLEAAGFRPYWDMNRQPQERAIIFKVENENTNAEIRNIYYFTDYEEAAANLLK